jgi:hypothetical protein
MIKLIFLLLSIQNLIKSKNEYLPYLIFCVTLIPLYYDLINCVRYKKLFLKKICIDSACAIMGDQLKNAMKSSYEGFNPFFRPCVDGEFKEHYDFPNNILNNKEIKLHETILNKVSEDLEKITLSNLIDIYQEEFNNGFLKKYNYDYIIIDDSTKFTPMVLHKLNEVEKFVLSVYLYENQNIEHGNLKQENLNCKFLWYVDLSFFILKIPIYLIAFLFYIPLQLIIFIYIVFCFVIIIPAFILSAVTSFFVLIIFIILIIISLLLLLPFLLCIFCKNRCINQNNNINEDNLNRSNQNIENNDENDENSDNYRSILNDLKNSSKTIFNKNNLKIFYYGSYKNIGYKLKDNNIIGLFNLLKEPVCVVGGNHTIKY